MEQISKFIVRLFTFLGVFAISALFIGLIVMLLWNWLMPLLFGLKTITWIQGWGLVFLCGMLFKNSNSTKTEDN